VSFRLFSSLGFSKCIPTEGQVSRLDAKVLGGNGFAQASFLAKIAGIAWSFSLGIGTSGGFLYPTYVLGH